MKIGLFTDTYTPSINGAITSIVMLKKELEAKGHTVYVITSNIKEHKLSIDNKEHIIRLPGFKAHVHDYVLANPFPKKIQKMLENLSLDLIHSHSDFTTALLSRFIAKKENIPVVHTYHTLYEDQAYQITKGHFAKLTSKTVAKMAKYFCDDTATEVIAPTSKTKKVLQSKYNIKNDITVIPTGIDVDKFKKENLNPKKIEKLKNKYKIEENDFVIITLSRVSKEKSIDFLIKAEQKLISLSKNIKLIVVGEGPEKEPLKKLAKDLGIEKNVIFTGKVCWDDTPYYYSLGNVFATSSTTETQGLTILEAAANGLIPVCIKDDSYKILLENKKNGYYFKDEKDYIKKIITIKENPALQRQLSYNARKKSEMLNSEKYAKEVLKVYEKALKKHNKQTN